MNRRKQASGGQAIVMVTLALVSMCGMMGLAVDLGWSFFVQKTAQAAADGAALAAVQETLKLNGGNGLGSITCGSVAGCTAAVGCDTIGSGNLYNGCLYATANGFELLCLASNFGSINCCPLKLLRAGPISFDSLRAISGKATWFSINVELGLKSARWHYYRIRYGQICVAR